jgi:hypothetical protein
MEDVMIKSHPISNPSPASGGGCPEGAGEGFVQRAEKVSLLRLLREDVSCVFQRDPAARSRFEVLTTYPGVHAVCCPGLHACLPTSTSTREPLSAGASSSITARAW